MRTHIAMAAVVLATAANATPIEGEAHPSFLQAGLFFLTLMEPPRDVSFVSKTDAIVRMPAEVVDEKTGEIRTTLARHRFFVPEGESCKIYRFLLEPPYRFERVDFNKLPSPRAWIADLPTPNMILKLEHEAWCHHAGKRSGNTVETVPNTGRCYEKMTFFDITGELHRRIAALDYIRSNFCPGLPEPPPKPVKPY